jgi:hypothetical protein
VADKINIDDERALRHTGKLVRSANENALFEEMFPIHVIRDSRPTSRYGMYEYTYTLRREVLAGMHTYPTEKYAATDDSYRCQHQMQVRYYWQKEIVSPCFD